MTRQDPGLSSTTTVRSSKISVSCGNEQHAIGVNGKTKGARFGRVVFSQFMGEDGTVLML